MPQMVVCPCSWDPDFRTNNPTAYKRRTNQKKKKRKRKKPVRQRGIWPEEQRQRYLLRHSKATERERVCKNGRAAGHGSPQRAGQQMPLPIHTQRRRREEKDFVPALAFHHSWHFVVNCRKPQDMSQYACHTHTQESSLVYVSVSMCVYVCVREEKIKQKWWTAGSLLICCNRIRRQAALQKGVFRLAARLSCPVLSRPVPAWPGSRGPPPPPPPAAIVRKGWNVTFCNFSVNFRLFRRRFGFSLPTSQFASQFALRCVFRFAIFIFLIRSCSVFFTSVALCRVERVAETVGGGGRRVLGAGLVSGPGCLWLCSASCQIDCKKGPSPLAASLS